MTTVEDWPHTVTIDSAQLETAQAELSVMLIRQNDQVSGRVGRVLPGAGRVIVLNIGIILLLLIAALMIGAFLLSLIVGDPHPTMLVPAAVSTGGALLLALLKSARNRVSTAAFSGIDRVLERTAKTLLTTNRSMAPYTSRYRSEGRQWVGEWQKSGAIVHRWTIDPTVYKLAIVGPTTVGFWTRTHRHRPSILWIFDPTHQQEIRDQLTEAGVEVVDLPSETPRTSDSFKRMTTE